jgi:transcriptional regulator with XRE-family HTH domain
MGHDPTDNPLGEFIRQQRQLSEMSMRQAAALAGISNPYLSQIERGLRSPSDQVLEAIAASLRMSVDALRERAGMAPKDEPGEEPAVVAAIRADKRLTGAQRRALLEVYDAFTA